MAVKNRLLLFQEVAKNSIFSFFLLLLRHEVLLCVWNCANSLEIKDPTIIRALRSIVCLFGAQKVVVVPKGCYLYIVELPKNAITFKKREGVY